MALLIFTLIVLVISMFLVEAMILLWAERLFKIKNSTYKDSLKTLVFLGIASAVIGIVINITGLQFLSDVLVTVLLFLVLHYLLKRYYQSSWKKSLGIYVVFGIVGVIVSLLIVIPIRFYIFSPFVVAGEAMSPTYNNGDYLLINKIDKNFKRSDVIVFKHPEDPSRFFIKRLIGLPSEKVDIQNGKVIINGQLLNESYVINDTPGDISITLNQDQYFVLSDNRNENSDSRVWGPITKSNIQGKVFYEVSSLTK